MTETSIVTYKCPNCKCPVKLGEMTSKDVLELRREDYRCTYCGYVVKPGEKVYHTTYREETFQTLLNQAKPDKDYGELGGNPFYDEKARDKLLGIISGAFDEADEEAEKNE